MSISYFIDTIFRYNDNLKMDMTYSFMLLHFFQLNTLNKTEKYTF